MTKVIFLGTGGTSPVVTKQARATGGIIIQVEGHQFHLDPGPGALVRAKEYGVQLHHTTAILVSSSSLTHCNDLNVCIDAMTHGGLEQHGLVLGSKSALSGTEEHQPILGKMQQGWVEKVIPLEQRHKVGIDLVEINAFPVVQEDPHAVGFRIFCPGLTICYPGDTGYSEELVEELKGTDILILNVPFPGTRQVPHRFNTDMTIRLVSHLKPRVVLMTHFSQDMLKADPLLEAREVQRQTGIQTIAVNDGFSITPQGYDYRNPVKGFAEK